ncbi:hypothetical protein U1872_06105 [Sphingomonas sp. RB3P16]|uniref:hypothetical protein n=1 Tax=Parasphingomonas frigoris TaxID=3096163 RepID=UPI002FCA2013
MTSAVEYQTKVTKSAVNMDRLDGIVNGDATAVVQTDGGEVPSLANLAARFQVQGAAYRKVATYADLATIPGEDREYGLRVYVVESGTQYLWGQDAEGDAWISLGAVHTGGARVDGRPAVATIGAEDSDGVMRLFLAMMADNGALRTSIFEAGRMTVAGTTYDARRAVGWDWVLCKVTPDGRAWAIAGVRDDGSWFPGGSSSPAPARPVSTYTATQTNAQRQLSWVSEDDHWIILLIVGQSQSAAFNADADDVALTTTSLYPSNSFMLAGTDGPRRRGQARSTTLVPLIEHTNNTPGSPDAPARETYSSGFANHFIRDIHAATGKMPKMISMVAAFGGQSLAGLSRGQPVYNDAINSVADAVTAARARGAKSFTTIILKDQGEGDTGGSPLDRASGSTGSAGYVYEMMEKKYFRQLTGDVMARTGETELPVCFTTQHATTLAGNEWNNSSRFGVLRSHGQQNIRLVGPRYQLPFANEAPNIGVQLHNSSRGRYLYGQLAANAAIEELCGIGYAPIMPMAWKWNGAVLEIEMSVLSGSLVKDSSGTIDRTGLITEGFVYLDDSGFVTITNVATSGNKVLLTFATQPSGGNPHVGYAIFRNSGNTTLDGPIVGPRGTIHNDVALPTIGGGNQYHWLCAFVLNLS